MTAEQQFFIRLLADHIRQRPTCPEKDDLDWKKIFTLYTGTGLARSGLCPDQRIFQGQS